MAYVKKIYGSLTVMDDLTVNGSFTFPTTVSSLTVSGATALNGTIALGNATADTITQTGHLTTGGNCNVDWSGSNGTFKTSTGVNTIGGDLVITGHIQAQEFTVNNFQYPAPGTDWTPALTGATLAANKAAKKAWIPLEFLKIGDEIVSYKLVGDVTEGGGDTVTLDCKLVRINKADPLTTSDVAGGGITQVTADGNFDSLATLGAVETVATDKQYALEILATTSNVSATEQVTVIGAELMVNRKG